MTTIHKINQRQAIDHIAARVDFDASALSGRVHGSMFTGRLPEMYLADFRDASTADDFYVVTSYATPIAWHANGVWFVPDVRYSVTTSGKHQSRLYQATPRHAGPGYRV